MLFFFLLSCPRSQQIYFALLLGYVVLIRVMHGEEKVHCCHFFCSTELVANIMRVQAIKVRNKS